MMPVTSDIVWRVRGVTGQTVTTNGRDRSIQISEYTLREPNSWTNALIPCPSKKYSLGQGCSCDFSCPNMITIDLWFLTAYRSIAVPIIFPRLTRDSSYTRPPHIGCLTGSLMKVFVCLVMERWGDKSTIHSECIQTRRVPYMYLGATCKKSEPYMG